MRQQEAEKIDLSWHDLREILDHSYDEIFVIDAKGVVLYVNDACYRHYGVLPSELIGKPVNYMGEKGYCSPILAAVFLERKRTITLEQTTAVGKTLTVTAVPIFDEEGELTKVVMNARDMSDIQKLKNDLDKSRKMVNQYRDEIHELERENLGFAGIIAEDPKMRACMTMARKIGIADANILILGESGVGKNVLAQYIHKVSPRRNEVIMQINCASIPENLLESELFGYCKGAFSGAEKSGKKGLAALAHKGTLFLDEVGELPLSLQAKLLQLVQEHSFIPIGGTEQVAVDIRIIAATNRNLWQAVEEGRFRKDLYYRLSVIELEIPPLRERRQDIPFLVQFFLSELNAKYKTYTTVTPETLDLFAHYQWPGNVRELQHILEQIILVNDLGIIASEDLPERFHHVESTRARKAKSRTPEAREREIEEIIALYEELQSSYKVAERLGISQSKATRIINKHYKCKTQA